MGCREKAGARDDDDDADDDHGDGDSDSVCELSRSDNDKVMMRMMVTELLWDTEGKTELTFGTSRRCPM